MLSQLSELDALCSLLPEQGATLSFEACRAALSERVGSEVTKADLNRMIHTLTLEGRVEWILEGRQLRLPVTGQQSSMPEHIRREQDIEPWFERYLWLNPQFLFDPLPQGLMYVVQNTARVVGTQSGRWTRPDVCMATVTRYKYRPSAEFSLFTFELKMPSGTIAPSVFEALSHTANGHHAYLVLYLPEDAPENARLAHVLDQAQRHGVGLIRIRDPKTPATYERLLEARRYEPPPLSVDAFIDDRFDLANRLALHRWVSA